MATNLRLRPLRAEDEQPARTAHDELADYNFFLDYERDEPWSRFVDRMRRQRHGIDVAPDRVRAAFLVAWVGDQIVGRTSIRFDLNEYLAEAGATSGMQSCPCIDATAMPRRFSSRAWWWPAQRASTISS